MEAQATGLAHRMGLDAEVRRIAPLRLLRVCPWLGRVPGVPPAAPGHGLASPFPDIAIGCGRRHAGAVIAIKRLSVGRTFVIQIQDPRISSRHFDVLVVPDHDPARGRNVIATRGSLNVIDDTGLEAAAAEFSDLVHALPRPRVAVCVGGDTRDHSVGPGEAAELAGRLRALAREHGCGLMVTLSRRTGPHLRSALAEACATGNAVLWSGPGDGPNPYLGFLGLADHIVVTSDSVNMVSEACSTGKPVHLLALGRATRRRRLFLDAMRSEGYVRPFDGRLEAWRYTPLRETERVAALLRTRLARPETRS